MLQQALIVTAICAVTSCVVLKFLSRMKLPPGPWCLPFIGNYRGFNAAMIYKRMVEYYCPIYGKIVTLYYGDTPIIFINDYDYACEALGKNGKQLAGRMNSQIDDIVSEERRNIFGNNYGPLWLEMIRSLKLGVSKCGLTHSLEENTKKAIDMYCEEIMLNSENETGFFPFDESYWLSDNIVLSILLGKTFHIQDEDYEKLADSRRQVFDLMDKAEFVNWIPYGRYMPFKIVKTLTEQSNKLNCVLTKFIDMIKEDGKFMNNPNNIIEYILMDIELAKADDKRTVKLDLFHTREIMKDILFASYEGIGMTNIWYMALLALNPEIQERIRHDIKEMCEIENCCIPKFDWRKKLHYIQACEFEFFRYSAIVGILDFHYAMSSVMIGNYLIPKNSLVAINQYSINHDPGIWENPETMQPERFLNKNGQFVEKEKLTPFGIGIRMCPGIPITKGYGFLLLCNLCLKYKIEWSSKNEINNIIDDPENAILFRYPKPYYVTISKI